jgi:hypothetical protein
MSPVEDRLRATARALAQVIPDDNPPPRRPAPRHNGARAPRWRRTRPWLIPLAAAAAVLAVVAGSLAITHGWSSHHAAPRPPAHQGLPHPPGLRTPVPSLAHDVPPYYVAITSQTSHAVTVSSTWTGGSLAQAGLAKTWFPRTVGTGANDRSFVVWASTRNLHGAGQFFLLSFNPDGDRTSLVSLSVHLPDGIMADMMAISPDGKQLAVAYNQNGESIAVFNLSTGAERTWTGTDLAIEQNDFLSWSADGRTVQYCMYDLKAKTMAYGQLNTGTPRTQLPAKPVPVKGYIGGAVISANGTLVVTGTDATSNPDNGSWWLARFTAATGRPLGSRITLGGVSDSPIGWASPDGGQLITEVGGGKVRGLQVLGTALDEPVSGHKLLGVAAGAVAW